MRLWHYKTIKFLPTAQLLGQWRECCAIAFKWAAQGSPKHALVNRVMEFPLSHYIIYCKLVYDEMVNRGYKPVEYTVVRLKDSFVTIYLYDGDEVDVVREFIDFTWNFEQSLDSDSDTIIFQGWHNDEYLTQNYYNLEEKYNCGCIPEMEWQRYLDGGAELI